MATYFKTNDNGEKVYRSKLTYYDTFGKRKFKDFYANTPEKADYLKEDFKRKLDENIDPDCSKITVSELIDLFIESNLDFWEKQTQQWYINMSKHIKRDIGDQRICRLRQMDLENFLRVFSKNNPNTKKPPSKKTIQSVKKVLVAAFNWGYANKLIESNPAVSLKLPKTTKENENCDRMKSRCLTMEEIGWIINTPHRLQTANMILLYTGMRPEELLALRWEDIDIEKQIITVNKAVKYDGDTPYIVPTKINKDRKVIMPPELVEYLSPLVASHNKKDIVVANSRGEYYHRRDWGRKYASYITDLDIKYGGKFTSKYSPYYEQTIKGWNPYSLRHTSATMGGFFGVDRKYLAENQGHEEVTMIKYYEEDLITERKKQIRKVNYKDFLQSKDDEE